MTSKSKFKTHVSVKLEEQNISIIHSQVSLILRCLTGTGENKAQ